MDGCSLSKFVLFHFLKTTIYTHVYDVTRLHQVLDVLQNIQHAALMFATLYGLPARQRDRVRTPGVHPACHLRVRNTRDGAGVTRLASFSTPCLSADNDSAPCLSTPGAGCERNSHGSPASQYSQRKNVQEQGAVCPEAWGLSLFIHGLLPCPF